MPINPITTPQTSPHECVMCWHDINETSDMVHHLRPGTTTHSVFYHRSCLDEMVAHKIVERLTDIVPRSVTPSAGLNRQSIIKTLEDTAFIARNYWDDDGQPRPVILTGAPYGVVQAATEEPDPIALLSGASSGTGDTIPIKLKNQPLRISDCFSDPRFQETLISHEQAIHDWFRAPDQVWLELMNHKIKQTLAITLTSIAIKPTQSNGFTTHCMHDQLHCLGISIGAAVMTNAAAFPTLYQQVFHHFVNHGRELLQTLTHEGFNGLRTMNALPPLDAHQQQALKSCFLRPIMNTLLFSAITLVVVYAIRTADEQSDFNASNLPTSFTAAVHFTVERFLFNATLRTPSAEDKDHHTWQEFSVGLLTVAAIAVHRYLPTEIDDVFVYTAPERHPNISDTVGGETIRRAVANYTSGLPLQYGRQSSAADRSMAAQ